MRIPSSGRKHPIQRCIDCDESAINPSKSFWAKAANNTSHCCFSHLQQYFLFRKNIIISGSVRCLQWLEADVIEGSFFVPLTRDFHAIVSALLCHHRHFCLLIYRTLGSESLPHLLLSTVSRLTPIEFDERCVFKLIWKC